MAGRGDSGAYIQQSPTFDVDALRSTDVTKPEFKELLVRMYQQFNNVAMSVNTRDAGIYNTNEFVNGQTFFANPSLSSSTPTNASQRQVHRIVIDFGALPNTAAKSYVHGIPIKVGWSFTRIYGCASDPGNLLFLPLPYASNVAGSSIELSVDKTSVTVTTGSDRTAYITTYIVLEYLKN
jgi:hypothetical protein